MKKIAMIAMTALMGFILTACGSNQANHNANQKASMSVSRKTSAELKHQSQSSTNTASKHSHFNSEDHSQHVSDSESSQDTTLPSLVNESYTIAPILYDGEDITKAMNSNKAPANTVHDGILYIYFKNDTTMRELSGMTPSQAFEKKYTLNNGILNMESQFEIPYTLHASTIQFQTWTTSSQGHSITWKITSDPNETAKKA